MFNMDQLTFGLLEDNLYLGLDAFISNFLNSSPHHSVQPKLSVDYKQFAESRTVIIDDSSADEKEIREMCNDETVVQLAGYQNSLHFFPVFARFAKDKNKAIPQPSYTNNQRRSIESDVDCCYGRRQKFSYERQ